MRGPKPKPAAVKAQRGAVRSSRKPPPVAVEAAPAAVRGPRAPAWLDGEGLVEWNARAGMLSAAKLLTEIDVGAFARYCANVARWRSMMVKVKAEGETYEVESAHGKYIRAHPLAARMDSLEVRLIALEDRFGLNPAERQRIMVSRAAPGGAGDLFDRPPTDTATAPAQTAPAPASPIGMLN